MPLPRPLLARLRRYWKQERPTSPTRYFFVPQSGDAPLHETTLQKTFSAALTELGLAKHASIHTHRHGYATRLLEAGISLRWPRAAHCVRSRFVTAKTLLRSAASVSDRGFPLEVA